MNPSEFERLKPRKTYKAICELQKELESLLEFGKKEVDTFYALEKINEIKKLFTSGE